MAPRRALAGLLAAPVLVLTGCGDDSSVADPPVHSPPHSVATSDPPAHETADHFIQRWVTASNAMESGGSTSSYLSLTRECEPCSALARQITEAREHGGFYRSEGWTVMDIQPANGGGDRALDLDVKSAPTSFKKATDAEVQHYTGGHLKFRVFFVPMGESWRVTNVAQLAR